MATHHAIRADDAADQEPAVPIPSHRPLRAADPSQPHRRDVAPAGAVLAVMLGTLLLAAAINSEAMLQRADASPLGTGRDISLAIWTPIHDVSRQLGLTGPRSGLDALRPTAADPPPPATGVEQQAATVPESTATVPGGPLRTTGLPDAQVTGPETLRWAGGSLMPLGPSEPARATGTGAGTPAPDQLRRPTAEDPLRVLLVGDSTMDAVGASLLRDLGQSGLTEATLEFRVSSGLARPDFFDWPAHLRALRAETGAELVVVMLGANDAQPFVIGGQPESFGTDRWLDAYRGRVSGLLQELTADGSGVLWIGQPVMRNQRYDADMARLNQVYAEEVARIPRGRFLDARPVLADGAGAYTAYLGDAGGSQQRVRHDDGVHLTEAGADRLAPAVIEAINTLAPLY
jgi:lysophospholipase L1-like esterase